MRGVLAGFLALTCVLQGCGKKEDHKDHCVKYVRGLCGFWAPKCVIESTVDPTENVAGYKELEEFCTSKNDRGACEGAIGERTAAHGIQGGCEWHMEEASVNADHTKGGRGHEHHTMAEQCKDGSYVAREQLVIQCMRCDKEGKVDKDMMMCIGDKMHALKGIELEESELELAPVLSFVERAAAVDVGGAGGASGHGAAGTAARGAAGPGGNATGTAERKVAAPGDATGAGSRTVGHDGTTGRPAELKVAATGTANDAGDSQAASGTHATGAAGKVVDPGGPAERKGGGGASDAALAAASDRAADSNEALAAASDRAAGAAHKVAQARPATLLPARASAETVELGVGPGGEIGKVKPH